MNGDDWDIEPRAAIDEQVRENAINAAPEFVGVRHVQAIGVSAASASSAATPRRLVRRRANLASPVPELYRGPEALAHICG